MKQLDVRETPLIHVLFASRGFTNSLQQIIPPTTTFFTNFLDLLQRIFIYDPEKRITAKEALDHPFFHELAHPDDGTEAARIGREQMAERETM